MVGEIVWTVAFHGISEEVRYLTGPNSPRVCSARMKKCSSGAVNGAHDRWGELDRVLLDRLRIIRIRVQQPAPSSAKSDNLVSLFRDTVYDSFDARVQPRNVASTCQNPNTHVSASIAWFCSTVIGLSFTRGRLAVRARDRSGDRSLCAVTLPLRPPLGFKHRPHRVVQPPIADPHFVAQRAFEAEAELLSDPVRCSVAGCNA